MLPKCAVATVSLLGAAYGCAANPDTTAGLTAITPAMAFNDYPSPVQITGDNLRPSYRFDTMAGAASPEDGTFSVSLTAAAGSEPIPLDGVSWLSPKTLAATVPAGVPAGTYDVTVTDPRGQAVVLSSSFTSLGPDRQPPILDIISPAPRDIIGAGTMVSILVSADDGIGFLGDFSVKVTAPGIPGDETPCQVPPDAHAWQCPFTFSAPAPAGDVDTVTISATATDNVGNQASTEHDFTLAQGPTLTGLSLALGPAGGGTRIEVYGTGFVIPTDASEGTQLLLAEQVVTSAQVLAANEITAVMPPHDPGPTRLTVMTGGAESKGTSFLFVAAPIVRAVSPTHGPKTGGIPIVIAGNYFRSQVTQISIGSSAVTNLRYVSGNRIEGTLAPGPVGPATVVAFDPVGGVGVLDPGFTYDPVESIQPDGGVDSADDAGAP